MKNRNWVRWLVIVVFAVGGVAALVDGLRELQQEEFHWGFRWFVWVPAMAVEVSALWAIACFAFFRQYRWMGTLIAVFVGLTVFVAIVSVPEWLGLSRSAGAGGGVGSHFLDLVLALVAAVAGWYAARWVFRRVRGWLQGWLPRGLGSNE